MLNINGYGNCQLHLVTIYASVTVGLKLLFFFRITYIRLFNSVFLENILGFDRLYLRPVRALRLGRWGC